MACRLESVDVLVVSIRVLVSGLVFGLVETYLVWFVSRALGFPMYAVVTVRTIADRGVVVTLSK